MTEYYIPSGAGESEYVEKRSRFLGHIRPAADEDEARAFIAEIKKRHYDARHNCWCYIVRDGPERYGDDGEPQGTAGLPMLEVLRREGVCNAVCVVTRYFGGVLLGAAGLLRAYTKSAGDALKDAGVSVVRRWVEAELRCPYALAERVKLAAAAQGGVISGMEYAAEVTVRALLPEESFDGFAAAVFELTRGGSRALAVGESLRAVPVKK